MHIVTTVGLSLAAGLHAALYGAWKDSPFESFKPGSFMRELVIATGVGLALYTVDRLAACSSCRMSSRGRSSWALGGRAVAEAE